MHETAKKKNRELFEKHSGAARRMEWYVHKSNRFLAR